MKKSLSLLAIAAGLTVAANPASAAYTSPYAFKSKLPPVQVDMSAVNDVGRYPAAPAMQPMAAIPGMAQQSMPAPAPVMAAPLPPASGGASFLDEIMSYHTGNGAKKKSGNDATVARPVNAQAFAPIAPVAPAAPVAAPLMPRPLPAPIAKPAALPPLSIPATAQPVSQPAPVTMEAPVISTPVIDAAIDPVIDAAVNTSPVIQTPAIDATLDPVIDAAVNTTPVISPAATDAAINPVIDAAVDAAPVTTSETTLMPTDTPVVVPAAPVVAPVVAPAVSTPAPAADTVAPVAEEPPAIRTRNTRRMPAADAPADLTMAFTQSSSALTPQEEANLAALADELLKTPGARLQLRAYATDAASDATNARRMSLSRGLLVRAYLIEKGISPAAIDVRALGMDADKPADTVEIVVTK